MSHSWILDVPNLMTLALLDIGFLGKISIEIPPYFDYPTVRTAVCYEKVFNEF